MKNRHPGWLVTKLNPATVLENGIDAANPTTNATTAAAPLCSDERLMSRPVSTRPPRRIQSTATTPSPGQIQYTRKIRKFSALSGRLHVGVGRPAAPERFIDFLPVDLLGKGSRARQRGEGASRRDRDELSHDSSLSDRALGPFDSLPCSSFVDLMPIQCATRSDA